MCIPLCVSRYVAMLAPGPNHQNTLVADVTDLGHFNLEIKKINFCVYIRRSNTKSHMIENIGACGARWTTNGHRPRPIEGGEEEEREREAGPTGTVITKMHIFIQRHLLPRH